MNNTSSFSWRFGPLRFSHILSLSIYFSYITTHTASLLYKPHIYHEQISHLFFLLIHSLYLLLHSQSSSSLIIPSIFLFNKFQSLSCKIRTLLFFSTFFRFLFHHIHKGVCFLFSCSLFLIWVRFFQFSLSVFSVCRMFLHLGCTLFLKLMFFYYHELIFHVAFIHSL